MTPREFLIELCEKKQELFPEIDYFTEEDRQDLESWDIKQQKSVAELIQRTWQLVASNGVFLLNDGDVCPWCVAYTQDNTVDCAVCGYGQRHGDCENEDSTYGLIVELLPGDLQWLTELTTFRTIVGDWLSTAVIDE